MSDETVSTPPSEPQYVEKSGIGYATKVAVQAGGVGVLLAALQRVTGPPLLPAHVGFWSLAGRNSGLFGARCFNHIKYTKLMYQNCSRHGSCFRLDRDGRCQFKGENRPFERSCRWLRCRVPSWSSGCVEATLFFCSKKLTTPPTLSTIFTHGGSGMCGSRSSHGRV